MEVYPFLCRTFPGAGRRKRGCGRAKPIFMPSPILDLTCYGRTNLTGQSPGRMKAGGIISVNLSKRSKMAGGASYIRMTPKRPGASSNPSFEEQIGRASCRERGWQYV